MLSPIYQWGMHSPLNHQLIKRWLTSSYYLTVTYYGVNCPSGKEQGMAWSILRKHLNTQHKDLLKDALQKPAANRPSVPGLERPPLVGRACLRRQLGLKNFVWRILTLVSPIQATPETSIEEERGGEKKGRAFK
jgi:hypothetical protein